MLKTLWCNWIRREATEEQIKNFYDGISNLFELIKTFDDWGLSRPEENINTSAELILRHRGSPAAYEALIHDFILHKKCVDGISQYLIKDKDGKKSIHTIIYDRGKIYRAIAFLLEEYHCLEDYVAGLEKEDLFLVRKLNSWCKS